LKAQSQIINLIKGGWSQSRYHIISTNRESVKLKYDLFHKDLSSQVYYTSLNFRDWKLNEKIHLTLKIDLFDAKQYGIPIVDRRDFKPYLELMMSTRIYEGIIAEFFNIEFRYITFNEKRIFLDLNDEIYSKTYNIEIGDVPKILADRAKVAKELENLIRTTLNTSKLKYLVSLETSLSIWINLTGYLMNIGYERRLEVEENIFNRVNIPLRLDYVDEMIREKENVFFCLQVTLFSNTNLKYFTH